MAFISERYKFLFVMSPRTGCTSIAYGILVPHLEVARVPWKDILSDNGRQLVDSKHSTLSDILYYGLITEEKAAELFKFCAVRNPFDSLVSLYMKSKTTYAELVEDKASFLHRKPKALEDVRRATSMDFSEWVIDRFRRPTRFAWRRAERDRARPQHMYARYIDGMDHVMRFERLHEDLDDVLRKLGAPQGLEMPNINPTPEREKDYRSYYTDEARRLVEQVFRPDMERFGYRF